MILSLLANLVASTQHNDFLTSLTLKTFDGLAHNQIKNSVGDSPYRQSQIRAQ